MSQILAPEKVVTIELNAVVITDYKFITPIGGAGYIVVNYVLGNDTGGTFTEVNKQQVSITGADYDLIADATTCTLGIDETIRGLIGLYVIGKLPVVTP